jgi:hypothetical protein
LLHGQNLTVENLPHLAVTRVPELAWRFSHAAIS